MNMRTLKSDDSANNGFPVEDWGKEVNASDATYV